MRSDPDRLVETAIQRAGVSDFGSDSFRDGLALIAHELDHHRALLPGARERLDAAAVGFLVNRLHVTSWLRDRPDVLAAPIERPVFIFGMPRTGTTLISNLLAQDPARRTLRNWEALDAAPPASPGTLATDPRVAWRREQLALGHKAFPALEKIHAEFADGPTECLSIHKQDFRAMWWDAQVSMPAYADWILGCDMVPAYAYEKLLLQILGSTNPGVWQLKMPSHALHLPALLAVFPDARLVWTHRDPFKATGSFLSLIAAVSGCNVTVDPTHLRWNYPHQLAEHVRRPMAIKQRLGNDRIHDVHYAALLRDPIAVMRNLYRQLGDDFTPEVEADMRRWLDENPQGRFGRHAYSLDQFGLTPEDLQPHFSDYLAAYAIEPEG
jgi:hypothetical protein